MDNSEAFVRAVFTRSNDGPASYTLLELHKSIGLILIIDEMKKRKGKVSVGLKSRHHCFSDVLWGGRELYTNWSGDSKSQGLSEVSGAFSSYIDCVLFRSLWRL